MKFEYTLKTAGTVATWLFGARGLTYLKIAKPPQRTLQEQESLWYKTLTPGDADLLRELQIAVDPDDVLQPGEKTPGRQILERFWAEDR
jgi:hypothetical protein